MPEHIQEWLDQNTDSDLEALEALARLYDPAEHDETEEEESE